MVLSFWHLKKLKVRQECVSGKISESSMESTFNRNASMKPPTNHFIVHQRNILTFFLLHICNGNYKPILTSHTKRTRSWSITFMMYCFRRRRYPIIIPRIIWHIFTFTLVPPPPRRVPITKCRQVLKLEKALFLRVSLFVVANAIYGHSVDTYLPPKSSLDRAAAEELQRQRSNVIHRGESFAAIWRVGRQCLPARETIIYVVCVRSQNRGCLVHAWLLGSWLHQKIIIWHKLYGLSLYIMRLKWSAIFYYITGERRGIKTKEWNF